nr:site-specific integrase [Desulfobulbaceae bacterium]
MSKIRARKETKNLYFDINYLGKRCREQTTLKDTPLNRKRLQKILEKIDAEITLGTFVYGKYFPNSPIAKKIENSFSFNSGANVPLFDKFAMKWMEEMNIEWRDTHYKTNQGILDKYLIPTFGNKEISSITKAEIMEFRSSLLNIKGRKGKTISPSRINHIMNPLRMILNEAANRFNFSSPYHGIKSLKVPKSDVEPFTMEEVKIIIDNVRTDFRNYYTVRFFTGMRTSEIDGLQWKFVDLERKQILVREALVEGQMVYTKNDGSFRSIDMSELVFNALTEQKNATGNFDYVFCGRTGNPLKHYNVTKRVWYPLLDLLNLRKRIPYQTRHTAATLWLASGESPEWISRQMGHSTTVMLFRVYSRFVPNLTRKDGSAFERLIKQNF